MSAHTLLAEIKKNLPFKVYGKGPVLELFREMGHGVNKKTPLNVTGVYRDPESGELVCQVALEGGEKASAALTNLKPDISHPLFNKIRNYRREVEEDLARPGQDINRESFRVGDLYRK